MGKVVSCKKNERKSINNLDVVSLNSSKKVVPNIDSSMISRYLSDKSKNDKINVLKSLINRKPKEINKIREELNLAVAKPSIQEVPSNIDGWSIQLDQYGRYRLYKYIKVKNGGKACSIQVGRKFSTRKAKRKISLKLQRLRELNVI